MMLDFLIVANPSAGRGKAPVLAARAAKLLRRHSVRVEVTNHLSALPSGVRCLVACGGDGTVQRLLPLVVESGISLGLIPCGRGNDWARALGIPRQLEGQVEVLMRGACRLIDLGGVVANQAGWGRWKTGGGREPPHHPLHYFGIALACGFDAAVAAYAQAHPLPLGGLPAYCYALLQVLQHYRSPSLRLQGEQVGHDGPFFLASVANYPAYGGGWRIAPAARMDDGLLDLCLMQPMSRWTALCLLPRVVRGTHGRHPAVSFHQSPWFRLESDEPLPLYADGEPVGTTPAQVEVRPQALEVVVGEMRDRLSRQVPRVNNRTAPSRSRD